MFVPLLHLTRWNHFRGSAQNGETMSLGRSRRRSGTWEGYSLQTGPAQSCFRQAHRSRVIALCRGGCNTGKPVYNRRQFALAPHSQIITNHLHDQLAQADRGTRPSQARPPLPEPIRSRSLVSVAAGRSHAIDCSVPRMKPRDSAIPGSGSLGSTSYSSCTSPV